METLMLLINEAETSLMAMVHCQYFFKYGWHIQQKFLPKKDRNIKNNPDFYCLFVLWRESLEIDSWISFYSFKSIKVI